MNMKRIIIYSIGLLLLACGSASSEGSQMTNEGAKVSGQSVFNLNCALCHGRDGKLGLNGAKDLTVSALSRDEMIAMVKQGRGAMMPYKDILSAKEVDAVVDYVRMLGKVE